MNLGAFLNPPFDFSSHLVWELNGDPSWVLGGVLGDLGSRGNPSSTFKGDSDFEKSASSGRMRSSGTTRYRNIT
jgi:hypothetical protein